jgi:hypothetical protein
LFWFAQAFPQRNAVTSICQDDWSGASVVAFDLLRAYSLVPCWRGPLVDVDSETPGLQPLCSVSEIRDRTGAGRSEELLGICDRPADPESPGWTPDQELRCTSSVARPVLDLIPLVIAAGTLAYGFYGCEDTDCGLISLAVGYNAGVIAIPYTGSSITGFVWTKTCRDAKRRRQSWLRDH